MNETIRTHLSDKIIDKLVVKGEVLCNYWKPSYSLWYSVNGDWERYCKSKNWRQTGIDAYRYKYDINIISLNILFVKSREDFILLESKYGKIDEHKMTIDWDKISQDGFDGIEIAPYQEDMGMRRNWYRPWDVASGAIWSNLDKIKLSAPQPL